MFTHTHRCRRRIAGIRLKQQPLKILFRTAWRHQNGTHDNSSPSFLLSPTLPSSMFNLLICIVLKIIDCCTLLEKLLYINFVTKSQYHILSLNTSFHLTISWCFLFTPPQNKQTKQTNKQTNQKKKTSKTQNKTKRKNIKQNENKTKPFR